MESIGVLGAGTWGTALASMLATYGRDVTVWSALPEETAKLSSERIHPNLPGLVIPDSVRYTDAIGEACTGKDAVLFAVPSIYVRSVSAEAAPFLPEGQLIVDVAKGIEPETLLGMSGVIADELQKAGKSARIVALSGPTHAEEVAIGLPSVIVSASEDPAAAKHIQELFMTPCLRVYTNPDIRGVELCGALKNVMALGSGIGEGLGYGDNARAALITRGMAEITRLGFAMGCRPDTFYGLAGIGDLIVTATSRHSRNNRCGFLIGQGTPVEEAIKKVGMVVEGIHALPACMELSGRYDVEMPLAKAVWNVVKRGADPRGAVSALMARAPRQEADDRDCI